MTGLLQYIVHQHRHHHQQQHYHLITTINFIITIIIIRLNEAKTTMDRGKRKLSKVANKTSNEILQKEL